MDESGNQHPIKISSVESDRLMHGLRAGHDAILIGRKTAEIDNPRLNTRLFPGDSPTIILLDPDLKTEVGSKIFDAENIIWVNRLKELKTGKFHFFKPDESAWSNLKELAKAFYELGINSLLIEGGSFTLQKWIDSGVWDECFCIQTPVISGPGTPAPKLGKDTVWTDSFTAGPDVLKVIRKSFF